MPSLAVFLYLLLLTGPLRARAQAPDSSATEQVRQLLQSSQAVMLTDSAQAARLTRQALARGRALGFAEGMASSSKTATAPASSSSSR